MLPFLLLTSAAENGRDSPAPPGDHELIGKDGSSAAAVAPGPGPGPPGPGGAPPPPPKRLQLTRNSKGSAPDDDNT